MFEFSVPSDRNFCEGFGDMILMYKEGMTI